MAKPFRRAGWFWRRFLDRYGLAGIAMPWPWGACAYLIAPWFEHRGLRRHELVHLRQIKRDGWLWFSLRYLFWLARYGYRKNPYEIEAYSIASLEN